MFLLNKAEVACCAVTHTRMVWYATAARAILWDSLAKLIAVAQLLKGPRRFFLFWTDAALTHSLTARYTSPRYAVEWPH